MWPLQEAQRQISSGEKLIWADRASPMRVALRRLPIALFGIPFLAFAIFWMNMASLAATGQGGPFDLFPLFGLPFVLVGAGMVLAPVWGYAVGLYTVYAITDRRLMIMRRFPTHRIMSYEADDIETIERREGANGRGDVVFRQELRYGSRGRSHVRRIGFFGIPEVRRVEDEIRRLKDGARTADQD